MRAPKTSAGQSQFYLGARDTPNMHMVVLALGLGGESDSVCSNAFLRRVRAPSQ